MDYGLVEEVSSSFFFINVGFELSLKIDLNIRVLRRDTTSTYYFNYFQVAHKM